MNAGIEVLLQANKATNFSIAKYLLKVLAMAYHQLSYPLNIQEDEASNYPTRKSIRSSPYNLDNLNCNRHGSYQATRTKDFDMICPIFTYKL